MSLPSPDAHPRDAVRAAVRELGEQELVAWCAGLVASDPGVDVGGPTLRWLGGTDGWPSHWGRVWAVRALRYAWSAAAPAVVLVALDDEHWRVREMAVRVARAREVDDALDAVASLRDDPVPRVRVAAERALAAWASR